VGILKLNVDASFSEHGRYGGAEMISRGDTGAVLLSACRQIPFCISPLEAELDACKEGIAKAREWSDQPCVVKMDSAETVHMIKASDIDRSCFTHEVHGIRRLLQLDPRYLL
jgi:hypothetical protein